MFTQMNLSAKPICLCIYLAPSVYFSNLICFVLKTNESIAPDLFSYSFCHLHAARHIAVFIQEKIYFQN